MSLTIDQLINQLELAKSLSKLAGDTVVFVVVEGEPYVEAAGVKIDNDEDGACCLIMLEWQPGQ